MNIYYFKSREVSVEIAIQMAIGDICIIHENENIYFTIVNTPLVSTQSGQVFFDLIHTTKGLDVCINNNLLFTYNGVENRSGNIILLRKIIKIIDETPLLRFLQKCIELLEYKEDRLSSNDILNVYQMPSKKFEIVLTAKHHYDLESTQSNTLIKEKDCTQRKGILKNELKRVLKRPIPSSPPSAYYFYDFLDTEQQDLWSSLYSQKQSTREILYKIKSFNKERFRTALNEFNTKFPDLILYSLKPESITCSSSRELKESISEFSFLFDELKNRGFIHISQNIWENKDHQRYRISIQPIKE